MTGDPAVLVQLAAAAAALALVATPRSLQGFFLFFCARSFSLVFSPSSALSRAGLDCSCNVTVGAERFVFCFLSCLVVDQTERWRFRFRFFYFFYFLTPQFPTSRLPPPGSSTTPLQPKNGFRQASWNSRRASPQVGAPQAAVGRQGLQEGPRWYRPEGEPVWWLLARQGHRH